MATSVGFLIVFNNPQTNSNLFVLRDIVSHPFSNYFGGICQKVTLKQISRQSTKACSQRNINQGQFQN